MYIMYFFSQALYTSLLVSHWNYGAGGGEGGEDKEIENNTSLIQSWMLLFP